MRWDGLLPFTSSSEQTFNGELNSEPLTAWFYTNKTLYIDISVDEWLCGGSAGGYDFNPLTYMVNVVG